MTGTPTLKEQVLPSKERSTRLAQRTAPPKPDVNQSRRPTDPQEETKRKHFRSLDTNAPRTSLGIKPTTKAHTGRWYVVKDGETLTEIAARELGDPKKYRAIWNANRNRIENPDVIWEGLRLRLP